MLRPPPDSDSVCLGDERSDAARVKTAGFVCEFVNACSAGFTYFLYLTVIGAAQGHIEEKKNYKAL